MSSLSEVKSATTMTALQRVLAALAGEAVDRVPVGPLAVHNCAPLIGVSLREYSLSAEKLAAAVLRYAELFEPDAVWISADTWVTAEAMGAKIQAGSNDQPLSGNGVPRVRTLADAQAIPPPDVARAGRYPLMLDATRRVRRALGDEVCIVTCFDQYPFSAGCALMGIESAMMAAVENSDVLRLTMDKAADYATAYATALSDAGADILSGGDSPAGLLGPKLYGDAVSQTERDLVERIRSATRKPVTLHICGDTTQLLPTMARSGADVLELDYRVDMATAADVCGPDMALWGNLDPVSVLRNATPEQVDAAARQLIGQMQQIGHRRFVLSSGCTLAVDTPAENLRAMFDAARVLGR